MESQPDGIDLFLRFQMADSFLSRPEICGGKICFSLVSKRASNDMQKKKKLEACHSRERPIMKNFFRVKAKQDALLDLHDSSKRYVSCHACQNMRAGSHPQCQIHHALDPEFVKVLQSFRKYLSKMELTLYDNLQVEITGTKGIGWYDRKKCGLVDHVRL